MRKPLGYLGRRCGAGRMALDGEGDSGRRVLPERMAGVPGMRRKRGNLAQKGKGQAWSSHRSLKRQGRDVGRVGGEIRRRRWTEVAVRAVLGYSGLLGRTDRRVVALRSRARG